MRAPIRIGRKCPKSFHNMANEKGRSKVSLSQNGYGGMVWYVMEWYGMVWYGMVWYGMVWCGVVWYGMVWNGMVWFPLRDKGRGWEGFTPGHSRYAAKNKRTLSKQAVSRI